MDRNRLLGARRDHADMTEAVGRVLPRLRWPTPPVPRTEGSARAGLFDRLRQLGLTKLAQFQHGLLLWKQADHRGVLEPFLTHRVTASCSRILARSAWASPACAPRPSRSSSARLTHRSASGLLSIASALAMFARAMPAVRRSFVISASFIDSCKWLIEAVLSCARASFYATNSLARR